MYHTLTCEACDISRNPCVGLCHAIGNDARQIVPTHGLNHQMHVLPCRKARAYSYHKRCHIDCGAQIFLCYYGIYHNIRL